MIEDDFRRFVKRLEGYCLTYEVFSSGLIEKGRPQTNWDPSRAFFFLWSFFVCI